MCNVQCILVNLTGYPRKPSCVLCTGEVADTDQENCVTCEEGCQKCLKGGYCSIVFQFCHDKLFTVANPRLHRIMQTHLSTLRVFSVDETIDSSVDF